MNKLEVEFENLCSFYKIPASEKPIIEFESLKSTFGWYDPDLNIIHIDKSLSDEVDLIRTLRHEFGHFVKHYYYPRALYHNGEEVIARTLERNPYAFRPPKRYYQRTLWKWQRLHNT